MKDEPRDGGLPSDIGYELAEQEFRTAARAEAEESEREAAQLAMRNRSLTDVAFEAMARGDLIAVTAGMRTFTGRVVYAAGDLLTLETGGAYIDFNLGGLVSIRVVEKARAGGVAERKGPGGFRGRMLEYERWHRTAEVGSILFSEPLRGRLRVAAQDHILFEDPAGQEWFIPLAVVGYVARSNE